MIHKWPASLRLAMFQAAAAPPPESCDYDEVTEVSVTEASEGGHSLLQPSNLLLDTAVSSAPPQQLVSHMWTLKTWDERRALVFRFGGGCQDTLSD